MRRLILAVAVATLVTALPKPDTYREKEDFQFSRSSSDDGTKSGFYGAQRGNMGGNYERAHNMDSLAQHQMSGLVRQIDGELGEGAKTRTGSVYTASNSRGVYGSGNYDLTNLKGRNFEEGESIGNSQSHSSMTSHNSGYRDQSYSGSNSAAFSSSSSQAQGSRYSGYQSLGHTDQRHTDNLHSVDMSQGHGRYENDNQAGYNMKYHTQYGSHGQSEFDQRNTNLHSSNGFGADSQSRFITTPVKVVLRPGGRVAIPIVAPTYAVSQQLGDKRINNDAELLNQETNFNPTNKVKHYESSYSYRKQWEKHHALPAEGSTDVTTEYPFPKNSELYDDAQLLQSSKNQFQNAESQLGQVNNINSQHRAETKSANSRSRLHSGFNSQRGQSGFDAHQSSASSDSYANVYGQRAQQSGIRAAQQSSASSDSYANVYDQRAQQSGIKAAQQSSASSDSYANIYNQRVQQSGVRDAQQSSASSDSYANAYGQSAQQSGIRADLTNAENIDMKPKSYHSSYSYHKSWERQGDPYVIKPIGGNYDEISQKLRESSNNAAYSSHQHGSHSRHTQHSYLGDADCDNEGHIRVARSSNDDHELQQQNQNKWDDLRQVSENKLEKLEDFSQKNNWDNLQNLGQQTQNQWDNLQQVGQETQNQWDNLQQLGQETQNQWDNLQQLGQETQNQWDNLQQLGQQTQDKWEKIEDLGQQTQNMDQSENEKLEDFNQESQKEDVLKNFEQQANVEETTDTGDSYAQQENHSFANKWDQITDFEQSNKPSVDEINPQPPSVSNQEVNYWNKHNLEGSDQSQQTLWYQSQANPDKNIDLGDFMKLYPESKDNTAQNIQPYQVDNFKFNDKSNPFQSPFSNTEHKESWAQNNAQGGFWNTDQYSNNQNTFWQTDEFNKHNFHSNSFSTSNSGTHLKSLWDKIDNIAGEFSVGSPTHDDKNTNSYFQPHTNVNQMQNAFDWGLIPNNPNFESPQTNIENGKEEKTSYHHNLFDEDLQSTTTTIQPDKLSHQQTQTTKKPHTFNDTELKPSADVGRGDIGPEEFDTTIVDKPYKTLDDIETLSIIKNMHENKVNDMNNSQRSTSTTPTIQISTTTDKISNVDLKPTFNILELNSNPVTHVHNHKPEKQTNKSVEILEDTQQQNLEQQLDDFGQQLQSSWFPSGDVEHVYNQQNMEQQFEGFHQYDNVKPDQNPSSIETLSLTSEKPFAKADNIIELNSMKKKDDINVGSGHSIFNQNSNIPSEITTTTKTIQNSTTEKNINQDTNNSLHDTQSHKSQEHVPEMLGIRENIQQHNLEQQFEDFNQLLQTSWFPSENSQQGYSSQNMDQQFGVFHQQENIEDLTSLQNFDQHLQSPLQSVKEDEVRGISNNFEQKFEPTLHSKDTAINTPRLVETEQSVYKDHVFSNANENTDSYNKYVQSAPLQENSKLSPKSNSEAPSLPVDTSTEKPGFWKSVGNKISSAKSTVFSWFQSS